MLLVQVCEKLLSGFSAYEGLHVIELGIESCSKGMYACGGEGGWVAEMYMVVGLRWLPMRLNAVGEREAANGNANQGVV